MTDPTRNNSGDTASPVTDALAAHGLLQNLTPETVAALGKTARALEVPAGSMIMTEGERSNSLYLVERGQVEIFRPARDGGDEYRLKELGPGEPIGEMSLLDGEPRSASARAETDCRLLEIRPEALRDLSDGAHLLADLKGGLSIAIVERMRSHTDRHVAALEREVVAIHERQQFGQFFLYTLTILALGMILNDLIATHLQHIDIYTPQFAWQYLAVLVVPSIAVVWRMRIPLRDLGITTIGLRRSLIEGVVLSVIAIVFVMALARGFEAFGGLPGKPAPIRLGDSISYFLHCLFQELVARSILQSSFQRFLGDDRGIKSVVLAALLFGVFHLNFGFASVAVTVLTGCVFGAVYLRHRNLAGVTLLHFTAGVASSAVGLL